MKNILLLSLTLFSLSAMAETELTCSNIKTKNLNYPVMKATIEHDGLLSNVQFDFRNYFFEGYNYQSSGEYSSSVGTLAQDSDEQVGHEITSNRTSYKGNNEFILNLGNYKTTVKSTGEVTNDPYFAKLILPKDLSLEFLEKFRIRDANEKSNAVIKMRAPYQTSTYGDMFLRMFCQSK